MTHDADRAPTYEGHRAVFVLASVGAAWWLAAIEDPTAAWPLAVVAVALCMVVAVVWRPEP